MRALLALVLLAVPAGATTFERGKIVERLESAVDPAVSYAYYLPKGYSTDRRWPTLFVFDPRSRGPFAAELFAEAAEEYGWIIVSSNDTRSDGPLEPNIRAVNGMWPDVHDRFSIDPGRIYATGFSGGAILAWWLAESTKTVAGVIGVGGRVNRPENIREVTFDWFGIAGETDFNYIETREIEKRLEAIGTGRRFESFEGAHRWAPKDLLRTSLVWMEIRAMKRGTRAVDEALVARALRDDLGDAHAARDDLQSLERYESIVRTYSGLAEVGEAQKRIEELKKSAGLKRARKEYERALDLERSHRARLPQILRRFLDSEDAPAAPALAHDLQLGRLQGMAREKGYRAAAAQRVLETIFVQFAFYLQREVSGPKLAVARTVAEMIRPAK